MKIRIFTLTGILVLTSAGLLLAAQPSKEEKFRHADKNKDGIVDNKEMKIEKDWEQEQCSQVDSNAQMHRWQRRHQKVSNNVEKKYDSNGDGYLQPQECKEMLKDKQTIINTNGKAKVDSAVEAEYDTNKDGVIDAKEAEALKEALK